MPKNFLKRHLPAPERIASIPGLGLIRHRLNDPNLWHLNRRSASGAVFWGLWFAFLPMPLHIIPAVFVAIFLRLNLPLCVMMVWVNNPFTLLPMLYLGYQVGVGLVPAWAMHPAPRISDFGHFLQAWIHHSPAIKTHIRLAGLLEPVLLGMLVSGFLFGGIGYLLMNQIWRLHVVRAWKRRQNRRSR